ncbi:SDR family oxidoreductase [Pseudoxanthobacter sp. M-2]|uniref:SDR family NAD(P)-dependent oxidoreductase n=1 Tax=Pseudoxanthobacter sp. M-2 TaxID=3078754 RepID=UPI0038FCCF28
MTGRFDGKIALVTGAGGGIGFAIARDLASAGATVHAFDLKPAPAALRGLDGLVFHQGDLCDGADVAALMTAIGDRHGRLDAVVNAAGLCLFERDGSVETAADDVFALTFDVNLNGAMRVVRGALPLMRAAGGGAFVHIASVVGLRNMENILGGGPADAYQLSKAALVSLSRSLAMQFAHENIRSNTVCPGAIATPMTADIYADPARVAAMEARTPLKRVGRPEDVSAATLFLLGESASFITGTDLVVDGGLLAKL